MTSTNVKKVSLEQLRGMVREAVALQLAKSGKKKESGVEKREKTEKDKEKGDDNSKPFGGKQAAPFGSKKEKNEGVQKVTLEQLRGMVKETVSAKLKEMGQEWGTEFSPEGEDSLARTLGADMPDPVKSPEEREKAYDMAMGTDPSVSGWEETSKSELEHAKTMLDRLGTTKGGRAALKGLIQKLEDRLGVVPTERHFAGDRGEMGEATPAYTPPVARPQAAGGTTQGLGGVAKKLGAGAPGGAEITDPAEREKVLKQARASGSKALMPWQMEQKKK